MKTLQDVIEDLKGVQSPSECAKICCENRRYFVNDKEGHDKLMEMRDYYLGIAEYDFVN